MRNLTINAILNRKEVPATLYVHGSVMVYTANSMVQLRESESPSINPTILILDLIITEEPGPMKGMPRHFSYSNSSEQVTNYKQVKIRPNQEDEINIDVELFG
jgi:hypothetical protein